ncbi:MAG: pyridoxamine 5'-phosphate oxidase family protein [Chloroflexota bacterium]|nr:pyridoxamine 5'-phosphate oxidase family protein [Dehalococcoidia bacterium]MDW8254360.1 pyridoxamine 5'-phosphate oxidase family protein [Chloroflexota bacterium]
MMAPHKTWDKAHLDRIQAILDRTAKNARPEAARIFARDDWRFNAEQFMEFWQNTHWCTVASVGPNGQPHLAVIHSYFQPDGRLTMRMFTNSLRAKDLQTNNRVALNKNADGAVATVYGRARIVPGSEAVRQGAESVEVEIDITSIYAMKPKRD